MPDSSTVTPRVRAAGSTMVGVVGAAGGGGIYWRSERGGGAGAQRRGMPLEVWIIFTALVVAAVLLLPRILPPTGPICTRCEGTGAVNERWPDPSKPGGWHELSGKCPKCDGKGRLRR